MTPEETLWLGETRRHFFNRGRFGLGQIALAPLLNERKLFGADTKPVNPMAPKPPNFPPKIKNVIFLFMAGAPSQLDLFDYKPKLKEYTGQVAPDSIMKGKRFAFMDTFIKDPPKLLGTQREFKQYGKSGFSLSSLLPNTPPIPAHLPMLHPISTITSH